MTDNIISFPVNFFEELDPADMNREQLLVYKTQLEDQIAQLDAREPRNENSEAYEDWAEEHEDLEDLLDEVLDLLEDL